MTDIYVGVDCGGTNIRIACSDISGEIKLQKSIPTQSGEYGPGLEEKITGIIEEAMQNIDKGEYRIRSIGMGIPGVYYDEKVLMCPNIQGLKAKEIIGYFREKHEITFNILNDVKCAALGEKWLGAGRNANNLVFINIGTGLSLAFILNGELLLGENNAAGEIAYWVPDINIEEGYSKGRAPLEEVFSGNGLTDRVKEIYKKNIGLQGFKDINSINTKLIFEEYRKGNKHIAGVIDEGVKYLSAMIANISILLNPGMIVFGGGVAQDFDLFFEHINDYLQKMVPFPPSIAKSDLSGNAGLYGAIRLAIMSAEKK